MNKTYHTVYKKNDYLSENYVIYVYENEMIVFANKQRSKSAGLAGKNKYLLSNMAKMYWIYQEQPSIKYLDADTWNKFEVFDIINYGGDSYDLKDIADNNLTTISGKDYTFTG